MNPWQQVRRRFLPPLQEGDAVPVALPFQGIVSRPAVGMNQTPGFNGVLHKGHQALSRRIGDAPHTNASDPLPIFLCSNHQQCLALGLPPSHPFLFAAPEGLVDFYRSRQALPPRSHRGSSQFVQPGPGRIVAAQAQCPLDTHGAGAVLLTRDGPHRPKPKRQRFAGVLEDRSCRYRALMPATGALQQSPTHRPTLPPATLRAQKATRPPQLYQLVPTGRLCREAGLKFGQIPRIVLHERPYYILGLPESSRYPILSKSNFSVAVFHT